MRRGVSGRPFRALYKAQRRMLGRASTGWMYPLLAVAGVAVIRFLLPEAYRETASLLLAMFLALGMSVIATAAVMHEKENGLLPAFYISGVKPWRYLLSRCCYAAVAALLSGCFVLWFGDPAVIRIEKGAVVWSALLQGNLPRLCMGAALMILLSVCSVCLAMLPALMCETLGGYTFSGAVLAVLLCGPAAWDLLSPLPQGFLFHPAVLAGRLIRSPEMLARRLTLEPLLMPLLSFALFALLCLAIGRLCAGGLLHGKGGASA